MIVVNYMNQYVFNLDLSAECKVPDIAKIDGETLLML